jgi:hypothetical protein
MVATDEVTSGMAKERSVADVQETGLQSLDAG